MPAKKPHQQSHEVPRYTITPMDITLMSVYGAAVDAWNILRAEQGVEYEDGVVDRVPPEHLVARMGISKYHAKRLLTNLAQVGLLREVR